MEKNYFQELNDIDVSKYSEKKQGLTYLSWSFAWAEIKKRYPSAQDKIYERIVDEYGNTVNYFTDGKTCWVKVGVTVNDIEHIVELPVMDNRNKSIPFEQVTSMDVNKAIQRCMTKAIAKHGLGLYIYNGEDLPEVVSDEQNAKAEELEALNKAKTEVKNRGSELINAGISKETVMEIVGKHNNGNKNPSSITSVDVCDAILKEFKEATQQKTTKKTTKENKQ